MSRAFGANFFNMDDLIKKYEAEAMRLQGVIDHMPKAETPKDTYLEGFAKGQLSVYEKLLYALKTK